MYDGVWSKRINSTLRLARSGSVTSWNTVCIMFKKPVLVDVYEVLVVDVVVSRTEVSVVGMTIVVVSVNETVLKLVSVNWNRRLSVKLTYKETVKPSFNTSVIGRSSVKMGCKDTETKTLS